MAFKISKRRRRLMEAMVLNDSVFQTLSVFPTLSSVIDKESMTDDPRTRGCSQMFLMICTEQLALDLQRRAARARSAPPRSSTTTGGASIDIRINVFKESFFVRAAKQWNKLPFIIRRIACSNGFKASLMSHFWLKCDIADSADTID